MRRLFAIPGGRTIEAGGLPPAPAPGRGGRLEVLYRRHAGAIFARCRYLLRNDEQARDATQEVFARALLADAELREAASPGAFLLRAATNHCLNLRRAAWHASRAEVARLAKDRQERGIDPEARELVRALLGAAPEESREIAVLYFVDELTQLEIARETGRSALTVRRRLRQFLAAARGALQEAFPDLDLPSPEELP